MTDDVAAIQSSQLVRDVARTNEGITIIIERFEDGARTFVVDPPLKLALEHDGDAYFAMDTRLSLVARGVSGQEVFAAACQALARSWDAYAAASVGPGDDGYKIGKALRKRVRVTGV